MGRRCQRGPEAAPPHTWPRPMALPGVGQAGARLLAPGSPLNPGRGPATPAPYSKAQSVAGAAQSPRASAGQEDACNSSPQHEPARGLRQLPRSRQHALQLARQQCKAGRHHWLRLGALPGASLPQRRAIIAANPGDAACPFRTPTLAGPPAAIPRPQGLLLGPPAPHPLGLGAPASAQRPQPHSPRRSRSGQCHPPPPKRLPPFRLGAAWSPDQPCSHSQSCCSGRGARLIAGVCWRMWVDGPRGCRAPRCPQSERKGPVLPERGC